MALAFPFLYIKENTPLPRLRFQEFTFGTMQDFGPSLKRPLVLVFWGADLDSKRERSIKVLGDIQKARSFYQKRNIGLAAVFVQPDQVSHINDIIDQANIDFQVYVDIEKQSFEKIGVYVMPSILIVSEDGMIRKGLGYTYNLDEIIPGEIEIMLHEKNRAEVNSEINPVMVETPANQRRAHMDYNYARNLLKRHEINLALEYAPDFVPALVERAAS